MGSTKCGHGVLPRTPSLPSPPAPEPALQAESPSAAAEGWHHKELSHADFAARRPEFETHCRHAGWVSLMLLISQWLHLNYLKYFIYLFLAA